MKEAKIELHNVDCLPFMKQCEDNQFDLAIVDPPYGIGDKLKSGEGRNSKFKKDTNVSWDVAPTDEYFKELFRVSKSQIIWGSNYFKMPPTRCNVIWDKIQEFSGSDFELAWTSFNGPSKAFRMSRVEAYSSGKIHVCQKPVALYKWLLQNYAKEGDKIFDSHLGSGSIACACHDMHFDLVGCELDKEYFEKASERLKIHRQQLSLF